jgi:hypothetical protein
MFTWATTTVTVVVVTVERLIGGLTVNIGLCQQGG